MKLLVIGGHDYTDRAAVFSALDRVDKKRQILLIIETGEPGAAALAREWACERGASYVEFPVPAEDKRKFADDAGGMRNGNLLMMMAPDGAVAFPGGPETADMVSRCRAARISVWEPVAGPAQSPVGA